jgi:hypothetical protein
VKDKERRATDDVNNHACSHSGKIQSPFHGSERDARRRFGGNDHTRIHTVGGSEDTSLSLEVKNTTTGQ